MRAMRTSKILPLLVAAGLIGCQDQPTAPDATLSPAFDVAATSSSALGTLYGVNQFGELYSIDPLTAAATFIGPGHPATENEFDNNTGTLYSEGSDGDTQLCTIDPSTGGVLGCVNHAFGALNGLEFVGTTLYGTFITFGGAPSALVTVDASTGALTTVGPTGLGPITGLAYDAAAGVMYGSTRGVSGPADLVTVNLATGATTVVGSMGITRLGSIELFAGTMYAATSQFSATPGALYTVNTSTGAATLVAPISGLLLQSITGLTTAGPESILIVEIDIKPGSDPNSINCNNDKGAVAVAILTTPDFDATTVDHTTVTFEGAGETHIDNKTGLPRRHEEDVDGDGDIDLVFHFRLGDTGLDCASTEGTLSGETFDGQAIEGTDAVRMIDVP